MKKNMIKGFALVAVSVLGITGLSLAPANASASNKTMIVQESNALSGLNTGVNGFNLLTNSDVLGPTGAGFYYYNDKAQLVRNTAFGTFKIAENNCAASATADKAVLDAQFGCFKVIYTVKKGLKYSDGVLITAQDLLLSHMVSSSDYSIAAGLGDPNVSSKFDSAGYGGAYDAHTRANSFALSDDNFSVTVSYDSFQPDWQIFGPGPGAVHALTGMASGEDTLLGTRDAASYKNAFESAYYTAIKPLPAQSKRTYAAALKARTAARALLSDIADVWSNDFNTTTVDADTNPLLLVSNGTFLLQSCTSTGCTLVKNPNGNIGGAPKQTGNLEKIIFKFSAGTLDDTAVGQSIVAGTVDIYSGGATSAFWSIVNGAAGVTAFKGNILTYEHLDLRTGSSVSPMVETATVKINYTNSNGASVNCNAPYTGPFAGNGEKAKDLRKAYMLVVPRQTIANNYIGKIFDPAFTGTSPTLDSSFSLTTEGDYAKVTAGSSLYLNDFKKTQDDRVAQALALVKKWYPSAGPGSNSFTVQHLTSSRPLRVANAGLIATEAAKAGIRVVHTIRSTWSAELDCNFYDSAEFAWVKTGLSQTGSNPNYEADGGNNSAGWNDSTLDSLLGEFEKPQTATSLITTKINAEKRLWSNYYTLQLYQWPGSAAWNSSLKNVLPSPLAPNVTWNYWQLGY